MLTGGFLGWQPLAVALALTTLIALGLETRRRVTAGFFAFLLALEVGVAWLGWAWLGPVFRPVLFDAAYLAVFLVVLSVALVVFIRGVSGSGGSPPAR